MKTIAAAIVLALASPPAFAQANGNLAPGGIVDGAKAGLNGAEGTAPGGAARPAGAGDQEGRQAATTGSEMVKQGNTGARAPTEAETPAKR